MRKEPEQKTNIGGGWHTDHSYDPEPAMGSILLARELPEEGGDTLFANMYRAFETLSPGLQRTLEGMSAVHGSAHIFGAKGVNAANPEGASRYGNQHLVGDDVMHPVVIRHPLSGRKALYVNPAFTLRFEGWSAEDSRPLLELSLSPRVAAGIHLPLPLARGLDRLLGQPRDLALRRQRLSAASAG